MKKAGFFILLFLLIPSKVFASNVNVTTTGDSNVSVNSTSNGESTTCINGNCTTTGGGSSSKVCVNGVCHESSGDMDINDNSGGGNTSVHIKTSTGNNSVSQTGKEDSATSFDVDKSDDSSKDATTAAKKAVKKMQEERKSILDEIKEFFSKLFHF